jgi:hypothetical protein
MVASPETGGVQSQPILRPDEVSLFNELVDYRDRSHLAGRHDDEYVVVFIGSEGDLTHPGLAKPRQVSMRTLRRFESLGLLDVLNRTDAAMAFDLADDFRDKWDRLTGGPAAAGDLSPARAAQTAAESSAASSTLPPDHGIFLSCAESQKKALAQPFRARLREDGLRGFIVSDEPLPEGTFTPEEKVDAYLERSNAVVVFATGDLASGDDRYTRPNIADEIARARSKPQLRQRVCVLKERGVTLPSNINPAYESLDPAHPEEGWRRALQQLREWGFPIEKLPGTPDTHSPTPSAPPAEDAEVDRISAADADDVLERAQRVVPGPQHTAGEMSLAIAVAAGPRRSIVRPAVLEGSELRMQLTQQLLFGNPALFHPSEGTNPEMSGTSLVIRQMRRWLALDEEATLVVVRPVRRAGDGLGLVAVVEEDVRADIEEVIRFAAELLDRLDPNMRLQHAAPVVALIGANYGAWRTRADQAANPNSMPLNMSAAERPVAYLTPPAVSRAQLATGAHGIADDLMVLLRRAATRR